MKEEFKIKASEIASALQNINNQDNGWYEDLEVTLCGIDFTNEQMQSIKDAASPTLLQDLNREYEITLSQKLAHAFEDAVIKTKLTLGLMEYNGFTDEDSPLILLRELREVLKDHIHNYPLLLGDDMPKNVLVILDEYQKLIPVINELVTGLESDLGIDHESIVQYGQGIEHIFKLDHEPFQI